MNKSELNNIDIEKAANIILAGGLVAFPTETVYGLGADATNDEAVLEIYKKKQRPRFNPLIAHCANIEMVKSLTRFSSLAEELAQFWPGPLTLVLPKKESTNLSNIVSAGLKTVAVRIPNHIIARSLIDKVNRPLAAPSANISGKLSPTSKKQVEKYFNSDILVLDGGECEAGLESTIIAIEENKLILLRTGSLTKEVIEEKIGKEIIEPKINNEIKAPGMLKSHYAPNAELRLNITAPMKNEAYLAFGKEPEFSGPMLNLSKNSNLTEAARNLFSYLDKLDEAGKEVIAVAPIPNEGLGIAINDRLKRASIRE